MDKQELIVNGETVILETEKSAEGITAKAENSKLAVRPVGAGLYVVEQNGIRHSVAVARNKSGYLVDVDSMLFEVQELSEEGFAGGAGDHGAAKDKVYAPMPGKIVKLMVAVGDAVELKQPLVIVEAMKMENQVNAKAKGRVKAVNFAAGDQVDTEKPIIELELSE
ncbi:MAG: biotin/lipoyl-containing protein [Candidatus Zixiibacteriota bacterium]